MMDANNSLNHNPPTSWTCYSAGGAEAASHSNLSLGYNTTSAVTGQMNDDGSNNYFCGHRRWILFQSR